MAIIPVLGAQWGDEGKGKICLKLCQQAEVCARFNGGPNAGHTVIVAGERFTFRILPAGSLVADHVVIGANVALDIDLLGREWDFLKEVRGSWPTLAISHAAHIILPQHLEEDRGKLSQRIGTTGTGTGPAYRDRSARSGIRAGDIVAGGGDVLEALNQRQRADFSRRFASSVQDISRTVRSHLSAGHTIIAEGAQGAMLDLDHGDYPYVTASSTTVGGVLTSLGAGPRDIGDVYVVASAYMTKVGGGPFPTKINGPEADRLQQSGIELDGATNKLRDVGWLDLDRLRWAAEINQATGIILTRIDVLPCLRELGVHSAGTFTAIPVDRASGDRILTDWKSLPTHVRKLVDMVEATTGRPVIALSVGPGADEVVFRDGVTGRSAAAAPTNYARCD